MKLTIDPTSATFSGPASTPSTNTRLVSPKAAPIEST